MKGSSPLNASALSLHCTLQNGAPEEGYELHKGMISFSRYYYYYYYYSSHEVYSCKAKKDIMIKQPACNGQWEQCYSHPHHQSLERAGETLPSSTQPVGR